MKYGLFALPFFSQLVMTTVAGYSVSPAPQPAAPSPPPAYGTSQPAPAPAYGTTPSKPAYGTVAPVPSQPCTSTTTVFNTIPTYVTSTLVQSTPTYVTQVSTAYTTTVYRVSTTSYITSYQTQPVYITQQRYATVTNVVPTSQTVAVTVTNDQTVTVNVPAPPRRTTTVTNYNTQSTITLTRTVPAPTSVVAQPTCGTITTYMYLTQTVTQGSAPIQACPAVPTVTVNQAIPVTQTMYIQAPAVTYAVPVTSYIMQPQPPALTKTVTVAIPQPVTQVSTVTVTASAPAQYETVSPSSPVYSTYAPTAPGYGTVVPTKPGPGKYPATDATITLPTTTVGDSGNYETGDDGILTTYLKPITKGGNNNPSYDDEDYDAKPNNVPYDNRYVPPTKNYNKGYNNVDIGDSDVDYDVFGNNNNVDYNADSEQDGDYAYGAPTKPRYGRAGSLEDMF
ncbi:hypothetical protein H4219_003249 [Mycoemilia scoparia]|uniref:Uncharacterized protein n=1 Tax=Mycoemilia scoparia TaxID=417184 RepID=A0A9W8A146_9FUNG|nr:hypothetical protein H4219_003249 [Mycoemilia scoparia]